MNDLRLITIDLDDTLWDMRPVLEGAERAVRTWLTEQAPDVAQRFDGGALQAVRKELVAERPELVHQLSTLRQLTLTRAFELCGYRPQEAHTKGAEAFEVFFAARNRVVFFPQVVETLQWLQSRFELIALTNGNANVERLGLQRYLRAAFSAERVGQPKPHGALFQAALDHLNIRQPERCLHVGDSAEHDVIGARRAGFLAAWINAADTPFPFTDHHPTVVLRRFADLPAHLKAAGYI